MPLLDFECEECKKHYEIIVKLSFIDKIPECPKCGKKLTKIMTSPMFIIR
jgi:putative FmdB family regulatory protein